MALSINLPGAKRQSGHRRSALSATLLFKSGEWA
jgi:hypothetical protein